MLKPALARSALQVIGATTLDEYRQHIETDPALNRRFQVRGAQLGSWLSGLLACFCWGLTCRMVQVQANPLQPYFAGLTGLCA
jgi:hypothetical protein